MDEDIIQLPGQGIEAPGRIKIGIAKGANDLVDLSKPGKQKVRVEQNEYHDEIFKARDGRIVLRPRYQFTTVGIFVKDSG